MSEKRGKYKMIIQNHKKQLEGGRKYRMVFSIVSISHKSWNWFIDSCIVSIRIVADCRFGEE